MSRVYLTCLLAALTVIAATEDQHQKELREHYEHLAYIAQFKCHAPQPRVLSVHHLFPEEVHGKAYFPDVTVLHRCDDQCGACLSGEHCAPAQHHQVDLPFKVTFLEDLDHHQRGSWIIGYHSLQNHTECACARAVEACLNELHIESAASSTSASAVSTAGSGDGPSIDERMAAEQEADLDQRIDETESFDPRNVKELK